MVFKHSKQPFADDDSCRFAYKHPIQLDCGGQLVRSEPVKRPLTDDVSYQVAFKRTRQLDQNNQMHSSPEIASSSNPSRGQPSSDLLVAPGSEDPTKNAPTSTTSLPRFLCSTTGEDTRSEPLVRLSFLPCYFENGRTVGFNDPEERDSHVYDYAHRKHVAIGPNHQADVPVWRSHGCKKSIGESETPSASTGHPLIDEDDSDRWMGTCVTAMPNSNSAALETSVGNRTIECICPDEGSFRCMRQHMIEAREKLKRTIGQERFVELGFCDMGEDVAQRWTEEEEQLFHEVVFLNPASSGKNFWDVLPLVLPYRSSRELVSYYFNVFMLRKRAEQNRSDTLHADSDDDEWQDSDDGEFATTDEDDEDSGVESRADEDDVTFKDDGHAEVDIHEEAEDGTDSDDSSIASDDDEELHDGISGRWIVEKSKFIPDVQPMGKNSQYGGEDQDAQDESCTSDDGQHNRVDHPCIGPADFLMEHMEYGSDGLSGGIGDHEYIMDDYDPKTWDIGYNLGTEKVFDFSPTCHVIEEVFGKGSC